MKKKIIFTFLILILISLLMIQTYIINFYNINNNTLESRETVEGNKYYNNRLEDIYKSDDILISNISLKDDNYIVNYEFKGEKDKFLDILQSIKDRNEKLSINKVDKKMGDPSIAISFTITYKMM